MNLAVALLRQGLKDGVEDRLKKSLKTFETRLGAEHPNVATAKHWLGEWYEKYGPYGANKAEEFYTEALKLREKILTPNHLDIAASHHALAALYRDQQKTAEADDHETRARTILQKNAGDNNLKSGN